MTDTEVLVDTESQQLVSLRDEPPTVLPVVVAHDAIPFPGPMVPVMLDTQERREAVLHAKANHGYFVILNRRRKNLAMGHSEVHDVLHGSDMVPGIALDDEEKNNLEDLASVGVLAKLVRIFKLPEDQTSALVQLVRRVSPAEILSTEPFLSLRVHYPAEVVTNEELFEAMFRQLRATLREFTDIHTSMSDEVKLAAMNIDDPGTLADFVAQHLSRDFGERLEFLCELKLEVRVKAALQLTIREFDLLTVGNRISDEIRDKVEKHQRDFFLREQLKSIRSELGETKDPATSAIDELSESLAQKNLPAQARKRADDELARLQYVPPESPEHNVIRSYLEWIAELPWGDMADESSDIDRAREILDEDHYGLPDIKERILEFLAVRQLNPSKRASILCFSGPPGVGKTSLGKSIARALNRPFYRFSVGGMRDEAEIKGHRRTYVGAMPGRILKGLRQVKVDNPVFLLDEIDKMGSDGRGDPSSSMLEVLDPAQNAEFLDHYLDLGVDLSGVMFIATANVNANIPGPLRDRLEVIDLAGYIPDEKLEIAKRHLVPRQRVAHGLGSKQFKLGAPSLKKIISDYTHEAGVRNLDRAIAKVCRKRASEVVAKKSFQTTIKAEQLTQYLGAEKVQKDNLWKRNHPGVAIGLAWTPGGGDVLSIEAVLMPGKGEMRVTGQLGEVMSESANLAFSYLKSHAKNYAIDLKELNTQDIHLHFPAGAIKKDGPSAGVTITTALLSLLRHQPLRRRVAMTGEMTLRGDVLGVGGIREKVVAAKRLGIATVIVPADNRNDVSEIPKEVRGKMNFVFAEHYDDIYPVVFGGHRSVAIVELKGGEGRRRRGASAKKSNRAARGKQKES